MAGGVALSKRILYVVNAPEFFLSHRLPLALEASKLGFEVHVATPDGQTVNEIESYGFIHHVVCLSRSGMNPFIELKTIFMIWRLFRRIRPSLVHLVTIKPVLYGGLLVRIVHIPGMVAAVSGLGSVFVTKKYRLGVVRYFVEALYRIALRHPNCMVIFQNPSDREVLISIGAVLENETRLIPGSGVDLSQYPAFPEPHGIPVITMAARLLREKGVVEFVNAARTLHERGMKCEFRLIGDLDLGNPGTITEKELMQWREEGHIRILGFRSDIAQQYAESHIVCLPSYYGEGLPKSLIEAAACGRAIVTTDMPGCRDAIVPGTTGIIVPPRDAISLANAIQTLIENKEVRKAMGVAGRQLAEKEYAIEKTVDQHMIIYQELLERAV
jgi:glycosyltransferase involved in cell wall biosynthesis